MTPPRICNTAGINFSSPPTLALFLAKLFLYRVSTILFHSMVEVLTPVFSLSFTFLFWQCLWHLPTVVGPMYSCILDVNNPDNALIVDAASTAASTAAGEYGIDDGEVKGYGEVEDQDPWEVL